MSLTTADIKTIIYQPFEPSSTPTADSNHTGNTNLPEIILGVASVLVAILALFKSWKCWKAKRTTIAVGVYNSK